MEDLNDNRKAKVFFKLPIRTETCVQLQYKSHFIRKLSAHNILIYQNFKVHNVHSVFWALDKFCPYVAVVPLKNVGCNKLL